MGLPPPITWPIAATGIATKNAPLMLDPGGQLVLDNVRQERKDEWRTRSGFTHDPADDVLGGNVPVMLTEAPWGGFVGLTRETTFVTGGAGRVFSPNAGTRWIIPGGVKGRTACSQLTPAAWSRSVVAPSIQGNITPSQFTSAQGGSYKLTAWWCRSLGFNTGIQVSLQTIDGATVNYFPQFATDPGASRPRVVYSAAANQLVLFYFDAASHLVTYSWSSLTGILVNAAVTLTTNGYAGTPQSAYLDARNYGGATITLAYRNSTGTGNLEIVEYNPATNAVTLYPQAVDCSNSLALFPDPDASGIRMVGVSTVAPDTRVIRLNNVGVIQTNQLAEAVDSLNITGVAYNGGVDWMAVYSPAGGAVRAVKRRAGATSAPVYVALSAGMFAFPATGAWRDVGTDAMRYMLFVTGSAGGDRQPTYLEMALEFENASAQIDNNWTEPQSRLLPLNAGGPFGDRACLGQVQTLAPGQFYTSLGRVSQFTVASDHNGDGPQFAIDTWTVQYLDATTYTNQNTGQGTQTQQDAFLPAGSLLQTATGQIVCSHGSSAVPFQISTLAQSVGAGSLVAGKTYAYATSVSMPDENGNDWRSPLSFQKAVTITGANNTVTVTGSLTPLENMIRRRVVMVWRTDGNGSAFKLLHVIDDTVVNTISYTFVDNTGDVGAGEGYQFQIPGSVAGELEAGITPALLHPTNWNGRLWGIDRDFPTRIRYSKPISAGLLPEFPDEFAVDIADGFGSFTGLIAMDDKIVASKLRAVYVGGGDGPDNAGNGSPPSFNRVSSETGKIVGAPMVSTGREVYLVCEGGLFRLTGGQQVEFVGAAIDKYLSMPLLESPETVTGMVVSAVDNEVRVQTNSYRFVHDRVFDIWIRDTGGMVASSNIIMTRMLAGKTQVMFTASGQLWREAADSVTPSDAGIAYAGTIRTAWVRPNGAEGRIRMYRARVLGECTAVGVVPQPTLTVFFDSNDAIYETFQPIMSITSTTGPIRAEAQPRRIKCGSFSLQLDLPAGDASVRLDAWSATVEILPGAQPISLQQKWLTAPQVLPPPVPTPPSPIPAPSVSSPPSVLASQLLGTQSRNARDLMWQVKEDWKRKGWIVVSSSDGNTFGNSDLWTDWTKIIGASGGGAGNAWILLRRADQPVQIVMQCSVGGTLAWAEMQMFVSPTGSFTGLGIARPTAPAGDELNVSMGQWMGTMPNGDPQFYATSWVATDGSYTRVAWFYAGKLVSFWQVERLLNAPTGWASPFMASYFVVGNNYVTGPPARRYTLIFYSTISTSGGTSKQISTPSPPIATDVEGSFESNVSTAVTISLPATNPLSGQRFWMAGGGISKRLAAASQNGFWGYVQDVWWTTPGLNDCDTMGDNREFIVLGEMILQWGVGIPTLGLVSPSTNYPTAQWYGRGVT